MDRQFAGYEVSLGRQYVAVFPDPGDLSCALEVTQHSTQCDSCLSAHVNFPSDLDLVQRLVIFPGQERENLLPHLRFVVAHSAKM